MKRLAHRLGGAAVALGLAVVGCSATDDKTQLTLVLTSETEIPKELDALAIRVTAANGSTVYANTYTVKEPSFFATTLALIPASEDSLKGPVTVEIDGISAGVVGVKRRAIVSYSKGRTLMVPMPLRMACFSFKDCGATGTCAGGTCQPATLDAERPPDFDQRFVFEDDRAKCFDEDACLASSQPVKVEADCTFQLPAVTEPGARPTANVSIRWAAAAGRVIALDHGDEVEGWSLAPGRPGIGKLSAGVCASLLDAEPDPKKRAVPDRALDARVSTRCPAKLPTQPYCRRPDSRQAGIGASL